MANVNQRRLSAGQVQIGWQVGIGIQESVAFVVQRQKGIFAVVFTGEQPTA